MNAAERAYGAIRSLIVNGKLASGFHLREEVLADQLGVSRTPIREALRRLNAEGLVEFRPNRGAHVGFWSETDLDDIAELRAMLQGHAARRAAERISQDDLERISQLAHEMIALADKGDEASMDEIAPLNRQFHQIVESAARSPSLDALLVTINYVPLIRRTFRHYSVEALQRSLNSHLELVEALRMRNPHWAETVMRAHIWAAATTRRFDDQLEPAQDGATGSVTLMADHDSPTTADGSG